MKKVPAFDTSFIRAILTLTRAAFDAQTGSPMEKMVAGGETAAEARTPPAAVIVGSFGDGSKAVDKDGTDAAILVVEGTQERNKKVSAPVAAIPHTPQVSSKNWRKIRSAVVALAAFRSRRVSGTVPR